MPKGSCCKAKGCTSNKTDNPELSFHSFPKSKERFKIWCDLIKRPDLNHSTAIAKRMSMRVCSLHFEDRMYMSPNNKSRLIWCAVPKPVTDYESSESQSTSSLGISESLDNKASVAKNIEAQEKQMGITALQPTESTVLAQPLPLVKGSKKFDWSLALDEDVIIKEESMMDQDNHLDLSNPPSPVADSPSYRPDTKEGILKHDHSETTDDCTEYSLFLSPSGNDSSPESPCEEETNLSHRDSKYLEEMNRSISTSYRQEMNFTKPSPAGDVWSPSGSSSFSASQVSSIPNVPSRLTRGTISTRKLSPNGDEDTPTSTLLSHVKDEPIKPNETLLDSWPQIENTDSLGHLSEDTVQPPQSEKTLHVSTAVPYQLGSTPPLPCTTQLSQSHAVSVPTTATSHSDTSPLSNAVQLPQLKTEKTSMLSSSDLPPQQTLTNTSEPAGTVQPFQLKTTSSPVNGTQSLQIDLSSPSISSSQSSQLNSTSSSVSSPHSQADTPVDSLLRVREPKEIQDKSPTSDVVECPADRHDLTAKFSSEASVDEEPIIVDEDDVTIVDEREDAECEKDCHCSKCQEKREKLPYEASKAVYHVHRTYSGPVKRQIVKTKGGGKRTFMILNKASLKVLQAKGLIQPLKKYAESQLPNSETLLPSDQPLQNKAKIQYHSVANPSDSHHESGSFENASVFPKDSSVAVKTNQQLALLNKAQCSFPQTSSQTPVVVTWSATTGTDTPSFTFTIQLPPGQNQPPGAPQAPIQIVTPPVFIGGSEPTSAPTSAQLNSVPTCSSKVSVAGNKSNGVNNQSPLCSDFSPIDSSKFSKTGTEVHKTQAPLIMTQSVISSISQSKNCTHTNTFTTESSKYTMKSPITSIQHPLVSHESSGDQDHALPSGIESSVNDMEISNDFSSSGPSSPIDESSVNKSEAKPTAVGFASGPCKIRKGGVKMYRYVNMPDGTAGIGQANKSGPKSNQNVRWVALPTVPISSSRPVTSDTLKQVISALQQNTQQGNIGTRKIPSSTSISSDCFPITPIEQKATAGRPPVHHISPYKSANKELKKKYARLLNKHRQRYHLLLKKYKTLESKFAVVEDAGTPEQVIRDAKNFLSDEHVLFLESQMFLRNRPGTGNRFSKRFMRLMIEYYKRSAAGYRFLRTIFTIPSVKTVQKWLNKPLNIREEERDPLAIPMQRSEFETADNREGNVRASGSGLRKLQNTANIDHCSEETECYSASKFPQGRSTPEESDMEEGSSEEYDSEESGLEEMDEEELHQSENSGKKNPRQNTQGSNDQEITIEWEEEPWSAVVME